MGFATRTRSVEVVLGVGQSKRYLLPPATAGFLQISVHAVFREGEVEPPDDGTGAPQLVFDVAAVRGRAGGGGLQTLRRDAPLATGNPAVDVNPDPDAPPGGGSSDAGPSPDVSLELKRIRKTIATAPIGSLHHEARGSSSDWNLVLTRKPDAFPHRRRFRVDVVYPSVLPELERRMPLAFLNRGFDLNWNAPDSGIQYVRALTIRGNRLEYYLEPLFAALYELEAHGIVDLFDADERVSLPTAHSVAPIELFAAVDNETEMAAAGPRVYLGLRIRVRCQDSREIEVDGLPNPEVPREFWVEARFYLVYLQGGALCYEPRVSTSLCVEAAPILDGFVRDAIESGLRKVENHLRVRQWDVASSRSLFDEHLKPWLVGNYELTGLDYDAATDELVLRHVGRPVERPIALEADPDAPGGSGWTMGANPRPAPLFETRGEVWSAEAPPGAAATGPLRPTTSPGALAKVDHVVVLMMENRSFDMVLGHLSKDLGHAEVEGLLPGENARDSNECDRPEYRDQGTRFYSRQITDTSWPARIPNPCHGHACTMRQISDGMRHFVADFSGRAPAREDARRVMDYFGAGALKAYDALTRHFAICDHWFGSHIGGTLPNRHILFSGDLNRDALGAPEEENSDLARHCPSERTTFFDLLTERGVTWRLYEHGYSFLRLYRKYTFELERIRPFEEFLKAAEEGFLPAVSFLEPDYIEAPPGNDDHAPADMREGQRLVARVVDALIRGPRWEKTLLIVTYDEHGGFFDHVVPPESVEVRQPDGTTASRPIPPLANGIRQLGPRVPAFVISPYTPGERPSPEEDGPATRLNVSKRVFEHASIPATILRRFCSPRAPFLSARVDAAHDLGELLSLDQPRPREEFASLLARLQEVIHAPASAPEVRSPPLVGLMPGSLDAREDFHGFIAYASALTGRG